MIIYYIYYSSLPFKYYNQHHCVRKHQMTQFSAMNNCSVLPLYGTLDLVKVGPDHTSSSGLHPPPRYCRTHFLSARGRGCRR